MDITITSTREFFRSISRNFISWTINETSLFIISALLFLICLSLVIYLIFNKIAQKKAKSDFFTISDPSTIMEILRQAMIDRSTFQVSLNPESAYSLKCSLEEVTSDDMVLELPAYIRSIKSQMVGRKVYVIFGIPYKKQMIFYYFSSKIKGSFKKDDYLFLRIEIPNSLELRQKRNFLRIETRLEDFIDLIIWRERFLSTGELVKNLKDLGKPIYKKMENVFFPVVDISALGIRLKFTRIELNDLVGRELDKGDGFIIYFKVKDERRDKIYSFLVHGIVKNVYKDPIGKYVEYGIQFIEQGKVSEDSKFIKWEKIDPKTGIRELSDWVMQKHLYYYRKGIA